MNFGDVWGYIVALVGGGGITQLVNWRLNKRKNIAEVKSDEIATMRQAMQDFYEPLVNRQNVRIQELESEIANLREERRKMESHYQSQILALQEQIVLINKALGLKAQKEIKVKKKDGKV